MQKMASKAFKFRRAAILGALGIIFVVLVAPFDFIFAFFRNVTHSLMNSWSDFTDIDFAMVDLGHGRSGGRLQWKKAVQIIQVGTN